MNSLSSVDNCRQAQLLLSVCRESDAGTMNSEQNRVKHRCTRGLPVGSRSVKVLIPGQFQIVSPKYKVKIGIRVCDAIRL